MSCLTSFQTVCHALPTCKMQCYSACDSPAAYMTTLQDLLHPGPQPCRSTSASSVLCCMTPLCSQVGLGWKGFCTASFTTAMAVVMAELVRQVEVHCSERAQAIALAWNMYTAAMDTCCSECSDTLLETNNFAHKETTNLTQHREQPYFWQRIILTNQEVHPNTFLLPCVIPLSYDACLSFALKQRSINVCHNMYWSSHAVIDPH